MDNETQAVEQQPYALMDAADEQQIIARMKGGFMREWVYSFCTKHPRNDCPNNCPDRTTGLSWEGTREASQRIGGIQCLQPVVAETETHYRVLVQATNTRTNVTFWGAFEQPKLMRVHALDETGRWYKENGNWVFTEDPDPFAYGKAISKAQRNAAQAVIPTTIIIEMVKTFIGEGHPVKVIKSKEEEGDRAQGEAPRRAAPISNNQKNKLVELYRERFGGTEDEAVQGLDAVFESSFKHPLGDATLAEASKIISKMIESKNGGTKSTATAPASTVITSAETLLAAIGRDQQVGEYYVSAEGVGVSIFHLQGAIRKQLGNTKWAWPRPNDAEGWKQAYEMAVMYARDNLAQSKHTQAA